MSLKSDNQFHGNDRSILERLVEEQVRRRWAELPESDRRAVADFMAEQKRRERERTEIREQMEIGAGTNASAPPLQNAIQTDGPGAPSFSDAPFLFCLLGDDWNIRYDGGRVFALPRLVGLDYIHQLIENQGQVNSALVLRSEIQRQQSEATSRSQIAATQTGEDSGAAASYVTNAGMTANHEFLKDVRDQVRKIDIEIEKAKQEFDEARILRLEDEKEQIRAWLTGNTFKGKAKLLQGDAARAQKAVKKAIKEAIDRIELKDDECAQHLRNSVRTTNGFEYRPDRKIDWET